MILLINEIRINLIKGLALTRKSFQYKKGPHFYSTNRRYEKNVIVKYINFFIPCLSGSASYVGNLGGIPPYRDVDCIVRAPLYSSVAL